ncbi:uncharacterized protein LOC129582574 [Paramacrobiotus metropolitanus]|uniref:uncharacterized protein LOC129582574 n=1 Tax=Paramacrobiotus metropolitanus TaxID=2943436 RepID=UPI002445D91A|nr:uncharacterized protein LOC129582574 [Paramacrobiotus metropolitanus]
MSARQRAIKDVEMAMVVEAVDQLLSSSDSNFSDDEDSSSDRDDLLSPLSIRAYLEGTRYAAARESLPKSKDFIDNILPYYPEARFRQHTRMSKSGFNKIYMLIKDEEIFTNNSTCPQADPRFQLFVTLYRFGFYGNAAGLGPVSSHCGIGYGTVNLYTARVIYALLGLEPDVVKWPDAEERREISRRIREKHGFPSCVGFLDGTIVPLHQKPAVHGEAYFTRKYNYGLNATIICDDRKRIRYVLCGFTGSAHDSRVYGSSKMAINPANYFSDDEYLLADSA